MKVIRHQGQRCSIRLSQQEWQEIGDKAGWGDEPDANAIEKSEPEPAAEPLPEQMDLTVENYGDRLFAVYVNGDLLCVTAYRKGARAVKELVERLWAATATRGPEVAQQ